MIQLYVLHDVVQDKLIAEIENYTTNEMILGAVNPEIDGNHFKNIITAGNLSKNGNIMGIEGWWKWVCESEHVEISDEFPFEPENIKIKCLTIE